MAVQFYDRVSGNQSTSPGERVLAGRWLLNASPESGLFLNSFKCVGGEYLVPDASGRWTIIAENGARRSHGAMEQEQVLDELEVASIKSLGQRLEELGKAGAAWPDWLGVSPLVPGMSQRAEVQPLERLIEQEFGYLKEVCHRPRAHLLVDIERAPISRARRIPPKAASYLASHTEDWERPTLRAVLPKRILAVVRDDEWDIYENRVAVRLVDNLLGYCGRRIRELRRLRRVFEEAANYSREATGGSYRRQHRVFELWGAAVDANEGLSRATKTLKVVDGLRLRLSGLKDALLYRAVPRGAQVGGSLRITNILANDEHYRHVAMLWQEWTRFGQDHKPSPLTVYRERQDVCRGFAKYCFLLVIRALHQMRCPLSPSYAPVVPGATLKFAEPYDGYELAWGEDDAFELRWEGEVMLRVVPVAAALGGLEEASLKQVLSDIAEGAARHSLCVILFPTPPSNESLGHLGDESARQLLSLPQDFAIPRRTPLGVLQVSPWDLGSAERVGRALRWVLDGPRFSAYPFTIKAAVSGAVKLSPAADWLRSIGNDEFEIVVPPSGGQLRALGLETLVNEADEQCRRIEREHEEVAGALREATRRRVATGDLNARKKCLSAEGKEAKRKRDGLIAFRSQIEAHTRRANALLLCPVCGTQADARRDFTGKGGRRFQCVCPNCSATWGTQSCGFCGGWFPTLLPKCDAPEGEGRWGWVDRALGCDVLAVPKSVGNDAKFICPRCANAS